MISTAVPTLAQQAVKLAETAAETDAASVGQVWGGWAPWVSLGIFLVAFGFIASEKVNKVRVVLIAAGAMALLGIIPGKGIYYAEHVGIDWGVIFLLFGMMVIVGVLKQTGVFDFLGIWAAQVSKGHPYRLMVMLMLITAVASPFIDNVTTIMLIVPITIVVCRRLAVAPQPYIIAEILASNIGGASTLIGDPPNIIIGTRAGLSFTDFLIHMLPIVVIVFAFFVISTRFMFRKHFEYHPEHVANVMELRARDAITDSALLWRCLVVLGLVVVGFMLHAVVHVEPSIVALLGAGVMLLVSRTDAIHSLREVEWQTLVFLMGLFVMVSSLIQTGVIGSLGAWLLGVVDGQWFEAMTAVMFGSATFGAIFDNIPFVATMTPVVETLVGQIPSDLQSQGMWWAFALAACFSGNGTAIAASANVVGIGVSERAGHKITFWEFTKYGIPVTLLSTATAWVYVWLRYYM